MQAFCPDRNEQSQTPDNQHGQEAVPPLYTETGYGSGCKEKEPADAKIRWVPDMTAAIAQHIFRHDGNYGDHGKGP